MYQHRGPVADAAAFAEGAAWGSGMAQSVFWWILLYLHEKLLSYGLI